MGTPKLSYKIENVVISAVGAVCAVGSVLAAKQVMDEKINKDMKLWKKACIRTAGYTIACGAAFTGVYKAVNFTAGTIGTALLFTKRDK